MARTGENIYQRKDGRFEGRYVKGFTADGKPKNGYVYGKTYDETLQKLRLFKASSPLAKIVVSSNMTVSEWFNIWLPSQKLIKRSTFSIYTAYYENHIKKILGNIKLNCLTYELIQSFVDMKSAELAPKTVHSVFSLLRLGLKDACRKNLISDVFENIRLPKIVRPR